MDVSSLPYHHPTPWSTRFDAIPLPELFARTAARRGAKPLVLFMGRSFSYAALFDEARRFASGLLTRGIERGDRVGLFLPNVPAYVAAYYGAMLAGATVVNFSPLYTVDELAHQVEDSGTRLLVTLDAPALLPTALKVLDASTLEHLSVVRLSRQLPALKGIALRLLRRRDIAVIPARSDVGDWESWLADSASAAFPVLDPEEVALLQYTGGTTGRPKGAMLTHANLSTNAQQVAAINSFASPEDDVIMGALPLFHVFANTCVLNHAVATGAAIAMVPRFETAAVLKTLERTRPTGFPGVPTMFQAIVDSPALASTDLSSLKVCISGGAPLSAPLREKFEQLTGVRLVEGYGLTESSGVVSANPYQGERRAGSIGQVVAGTEILLLDKEDPAKLAAEGEPGELAIHGPQIMRGYWNMPEATAEVFVEHGGKRWLRTGDVARLDADGFLTIVDRIKDMIAVGGFKVFPSQVEAVLVEHPAIKEALVIGVPDDYRGEVPRAYVTLDEPADADALLAWVNPRLGKHERVSSVVIRDELPKTLVGKLDRKALRAEVFA
ncbi:long-chain-fatty-acid--CoA ligase [Parerythrobacter lacustris]|uniref:Long-chain fatty acid--CoA ligase n=1 Tax=Parerythrobacter lacustris TaxID=2969984 RepID=A0ABT1XS03_9SPHN|nr:long-chain fatty acid--CoA ligase [Parerythrobacter lacustris]MCR2834425.1 long-chain fatty acid--CoA ligase [Parerythrobacter lacustris]